MMHSRFFTLLCLFTLVAFVGCADSEAREVEDDMTEENLLRALMEAQGQG